MGRNNGEQRIDSTEKIKKSKNKQNQEIGMRKDKVRME